MVNQTKKRPWYMRLIRAGEDPTPAPTTETVFLHSSDVGSTGTKSYAGYAYEDYLTTLTGINRADEFDKMRRSDAQIKMCLNSVKNPIRSATWDIEPGEDTPEAIADAELVEHILFNDLDKSFSKLLSEVLTNIDFGHSVFEITDKIVLNHPEFGTYNGIRSISWRSPRTIQRWNLNPDNGQLVSVTQYAYGDLQRLVDIPAEFLLVFNVDMEGSNYEGISCLRPCYGPWLRKNTYLKLNAIGIEKHAIPIPLVKFPQGQQNSEQVSTLVDVLEKYTTHQANYIMLPNSFELDLHSNAGFDPSKIEASVDAEDKRMAKAFLANFLELGSGGNGGAYALSNDLSDFFLAGLDHIAKEICEEFDKLIKRQIILNRGPRAVYPKMKVAGISDKAGKELAEILKTLGDGKWLTPADRDEEHLRKRFGLPGMSTEGVRETAQQPQQLPPGQQPPPQTLSERIREAAARSKK